MPRKILHLDLDAFFCAVEEQRNPELRGKPFVVGGKPNERGVVSSASYPARKFGVRSAMPTSKALRLCPGLIVIPGRHGAYRSASTAVMAHLHALSPLVEQLSIDEAFVDISDLREPGREIAIRLQAQIRDELALPCSIGVASNKLLAKTATDVGKASHRGDGPPYAVLEVPAGQEAEFLAPLPVQSLWGVGPKTAAYLEGLGIRTIGELARVPESHLVHHFGKNGLELAEHARGIDTRPVETERVTKSISQEVTYERDVRDAKTLERTLLEQSQQVAYQLRQEHLAGATVRIKLRWSDFTTLTRQTTLPQATDQDGVIYSTALELFHSNWTPGRPVRLLGVGVSGLGPPLRQLSLWDTGTEKERRLLQALDQLRERFGDDVVHRGSDIDHD